MRASVIQIQTDDGIAVKTRTYREVPRRKINERSKLVEGFFAGRNYNRWGRMVELIGAERKLIHQYGEIPERPRMYTCTAHRNWTANCPGCYQANKDIE